MCHLTSDSVTDKSLFTQLHYDQDKVLRLPRGVHIVVSDWVSASLAQGALQQEDDYLIDLARRAALADKSGSHVRGPVIQGRAPFIDPYDALGKCTMVTWHAGRGQATGFCSTSHQKVRCCCRRKLSRTARLRMHSHSLKRRRRSGQLGGGKVAACFALNLHPKPKVACQPFVTQMYDAAP